MKGDGKIDHCGADFWEDLVLMVKMRGTEDDPIHIDTRDNPWLKPLPSILVIHNIYLEE